MKNKHRLYKLKGDGWEFGLYLLTEPNATDPISKIWNEAAQEILSIIKDQKEV